MELNLKLMYILPTDVLIYIRDLVYKSNYQSKILLDDIVDYRQTKEIIEHKYYNIWIIQMEEHPPDHLYWLFKDLSRFYLNNFKFKLKPNVKKMYRYKYQTIYYEINRIWGILNKYQRHCFIYNPQYN